MYLKEKFNNKNLPKSFEIFPPNNNISLYQLLEVIEELVKFNPDFITITCGASGNNINDYTIDIAQYIKEKYFIETMPHITCINSTKEYLDTILNKIVKKNLNNVLALRGDVPKDTNSDLNLQYEFKYASDLIGHIKKSNYPIATAAACYPEGHFESTSLDADILHLKGKVELGVDFLITQLFFDNNKFYTFKDKLIEQKINTPVTIGIMPVTNAKLIKKITSLSGASIPKELDLLLGKYENDDNSMFEAGIEYACKQIEELSIYGVDGFHTYVLNKPEVAKKIYENMRW